MVSLPIEIEIVELLHLRKETRMGPTGASVFKRCGCRDKVSGRQRPGGYTGTGHQRSFEATFFDYVRIDNGQIIERVQQADVLAQMRKLYGEALGLVGLDAMFLRL
jgi:hypothetical protein